MTYLLVLLASTAGCVLNTVCGFGFGVLGMIVMPYAMGSAVHAASVINMATFVQATFLAVRYRRHIRWKLLAAPMAAYLVASFIAVRVAVGMGNALMKRVLGAFLVALSAYFIFAAKHIKLTANTRNGLIAGGLGGVMSGLFATGGPPASLYFSATTGTKEEYLATIQAYFSVSNFYVTAVRFYSGVMDATVFRAFAVALGGLVLGNVLGLYVFKRVDVNFIRRAIYVMMAVSGLAMLLL